MTILQSAALLLTLCALAGYINQKTLRAPPALAMTLMSITVVLSLVSLAKLHIIPLDPIEQFVEGLDFADLVLHGLLALLLFAGALFVDVDQLRKWWKPIGSLITLGVVVSAFLVGGGLWIVGQLLGFELGFWWCVLFGSLIAPTDPIAALAIVRRANAPKHMEVKLVGESLFNDGTGVMLFLLVLGIIRHGEVSVAFLAHEVIVAPLAAIGVGFILGHVANHAIARIDHHPTEILITVALATGVYGLAEALHLSAPIAVVVAGLVIGYKARRTHMSASTLKHLDTFWEGLDEMLNAVLFALMGLVLIIIDVHLSVMLLGLAAWILVLWGRWFGVVAALMPVRQGLGRGTSRVLVWGGLRGGISMALALSLPKGPEADILVPLTFIVVAMSAFVQGLTLPLVLKSAVARPNEEPLSEDSALAVEAATPTLSDVATVVGSDSDHHMK